MDGALGSGTAAFVAASAFNQPIASALGGLVATVTPDAGRGHAAGWTQAGILVGGVVAGALAVWLIENVAGWLAAIILGLVIALPSAAALTVAEPLAPRTDRRAHVMRVWRAVTTAVRHKRVWLGLAFFVSPAGAGALMNLFSGIAPDYHASSGVVIVVVAVGGTLTAAGALIGGSLLDRLDRWRAYPVAGLLTGAVVAAMLLAPLRPVTYIIGASAYALLTGFCYAAFMALALELIGSDSVASGTLFTLFTAAVNVPVVYMLRLDGAGHAHFGVRGLLAVEGIANSLFALLLLFLLGAFRSRSLRTLHNRYHE
jgi:MFS family permease